MVDTTRSQLRSHSIMRARVAHIYMWVDVIVLLADVAILACDRESPLFLGSRITVSKARTSCPEKAPSAITLFST